MTRFRAGRLAVALGLLTRGSCSVFGQLLKPSYSVVFSTGFEWEEGYDVGYDLSGLNGWLSFGSGRNGVVTHFFQGLGQQGFVGFLSPAQKDDVLKVWRPMQTSSGERTNRLFVSMC